MIKQFPGWFSMNAKYQEISKEMEDMNLYYNDSISWKELNVHREYYKSLLKL